MEIKVLDPAIIINIHATTSTKVEGFFGSGKFGPSNFIDTSRATEKNSIINSIGAKAARQTDNKI